MRRERSMLATMFSFLVGGCASIIRDSTSPVGDDVSSDGMWEFEQTVLVTLQPGAMETRP